MRRNAVILAGIVAIVAAITALVSALGGEPASGAEASIAESDAAPQTAPATEDERARREREHAEMLDREYPLHGVITKAAITVRARPEPDATQLGWLRIGAHVRMRREPARTPTCASGFYEIHPRGFACAGQGIEVRETAPDAVSDMAPDLTSALPYHYYFVKEPQVPEWHQLPSRDDQRAAQAHADRYLEFLNADDERRAQRLRAGELASEPPPPPEVARWLDHGFFVAGNGIEVRSRRRFVRTIRGSYVKEAQLEERTGSSFQGVELGADRALPVAWAIRPAQPMLQTTADDGATRVSAEEGVDPIARLSVVPWVRRERVGDQQYHVITNEAGEERLLRDWVVTVAEARDRPRGIADDEPWVHVDISSQTLVLYRGATPIYATLVSTGLEGHDTPVGEFTIHRKFVSDTMADLGPEAGDDRYRIDDVPWTQYFSGAVALHAAFWHSQYGQRRSHGCVNLSPRDAQYVWQRTWPEIPAGWHGVSTEQTGIRGSRVIVTP